jgi:hypothetical protein
VHHSPGMNCAPLTWYELCTTHLVLTGIYEAQDSFWGLAYSTVFFASGHAEGLI